MGDSTRRPQEDEKQAAARVVTQVTGDNPDDETAELVKKAIREGKNPAAVLLGHNGGLKGGRARAEKLSKKRRSEIAKKAAEARWRKNSDVQR